MEKIQENHTIDLFVRGRLFSYVAGVASYICEWYHIGGLHLEITKMDMPMKSGLSSSAAICVMVARAFNLLYGLHMNTIGVMNIAYWGEQRTPSRYGRLDQACAFGVNPVAMTFDGNELDVDRIHLLIMSRRMSCTEHLVRTIVKSRSALLEAY